MKSLEDQLSKYAAYHRDRRNVATHFVGIPMIVVAIVVLLSRPLWLAIAAAGVVAVYYVLLDRWIGVLMAALFALAIGFGNWAASLETQVWLSIGIGGFVVGWVFQFVGHVFEGRKPAFVDDIIGLIIGPLFVVVEALFLLGMRPDLKAKLEARAREAVVGAAELAQKVT